jgi:hypothetical protein
VTGADVEAHLAGCPACRYLVDEGAPLAPALANGERGGGAADLAALEASVLADTRAETGAVARLRETPRALRFILLAALIGLEALFMVTYLRRADWATYPVWRMIVIAGGFALVALGLAWMALRPLYLRPLSPRVERAIFGVAIVLPFLVVLFPTLPTIKISFFTYPGFTFRCFAYASCLALFVILLGRLLDRGGHVSRFVSLSASVAGAYTGLLCLQLECPVNDPLHLVTGHALVPVGLFLGTLIFRRT